MKVDIRTPEGKLDQQIEVMYMVVTTDSGRYIIRGGSALDIIKDTRERMTLYPESTNHILIK